MNLLGDFFLSCEHMTSGKDDTFDPCCGLLKLLKLLVTSCNFHHCKVLPQTILSFQ